MILRSLRTLLRLAVLCGAVALGVVLIDAVLLAPPGA